MFPTTKTPRAAGLAPLWVLAPNPIKADPDEVRLLTQRSEFTSFLFLLLCEEADSRNSCRLHINHRTAPSTLVLELLESRVYCSVSADPASRQRAAVFHHTLMLCSVTSCERVKETAKSSTRRRCVPTSGRPTLI